MSAERSELTASIGAFVATLRRDHDFSIGHDETYDALRAIETLGVADAARVRSALRLICCASPEEIDVFERVFDAFFFAPRGIANPSYAPRHTRERDGAEPPERRAPKRADRHAMADGESGGAAVLERTPLELTEDPVDAWQAMRAHYSPLATSAQPPAIAAEDFDAMLVAANRLIAGVRIGRSRRWKPHPRGTRFDLRRTLRASLGTGGDPTVLHRLGHPLRNPRFVLLVDGSRSMAEHTAPILQFAAALCRRTRRADAFSFSTELRDITRTLRRSGPGDAIDGLGEAWGGGTRIGASLRAFIQRRGTRLLGDDTVVLVFSDGLDVGDAATLQRAMRELDRRSAAVIWLNPHVVRRGYEPTASGMRVALRYVSLLATADSPHAFDALIKRIARATRR